MRLQDIDVTGFETLLLDRDGVVNRLRPDDYVKKWEEFEFLPGVLEILKAWNTHFKYIFIVTNQRGVGKEIMSEEDLKHIHERMIFETRFFWLYEKSRKGVTDSDINRKPGIGMFLQILRDYPDIDKAKCLMIGDSDSDIKFAKNCGIVGIKVI